MTIGATKIRALTDKFNKAKEGVRDTQEEVVPEIKEESPRSSQEEQSHKDLGEFKFIDLPLAEPKEEEEEVCST